MSNLSSEKKRNKRQRIIDAAIQKFAERGYRDAPVSEIAKLANVADGTIYNYLTQRALVAVHFEEKMQEIIVELQARLQTIESATERIWSILLSTTLATGAKSRTCTSVSGRAAPVTALLSWLSSPKALLTILRSLGTLFVSQLRGV